MQSSPHSAVPRFPIAAMLLVLAITLLGGCGGDEETSASGPEGATEAAGIPVVLAPTQTRPVVRTVEVVGTLYGDIETTVGAKVPGRIAVVEHDVGDRVAPGAVLAIVDQTDYELLVDQRETALAESLARLGLQEVPGPEFDASTLATVEQARLQSANASARYERARDLFEQTPPLISPQDFADLETAFEVAESTYQVALLEAQGRLAGVITAQQQLEAARQQLADTVIRAPFPNQPQAHAAQEQAIPTTRPSDWTYGIAERLVEVGEYVAPGAPAFRLVASDPIRFRASVLERHAGEVTVGQNVRVEVEGQPSVEGTVSRINPQINLRNRRFMIEVYIPNLQERLRPGAFARGAVVIGEEPDVTFVPQDAVYSYAGVDKVFTVEDGKAVQHVVKTGERQGSMVAIREGFRGPAQVVVSGVTRLANGTPVVVKTAEEMGGAAPAEVVANEAQE